MDDDTRVPANPGSGSFGSTGDPAVHAVTELLHSELALAIVEEPALVDSLDSGRVWLLWFAIGATQEVCDLVQRETDRERNLVFRQVVGAIFTDGVRSGMDPVHADRRLIEIFESAGAEAVRACVRGDRRLGYYLEALKVGSSDLRLRSPHPAPR
jgi:hypothetical protein